MTLLQYIEAITRLANGALTVLVKMSDGRLTLPMSVRAAAEYLYGGDKPSTKRMPSEENEMYTDPDIQKANEKAKARVLDRQVRNFYEHGVLPALTWGASELFTNGDPRNMTLATAGAVGTRAGMRLLPFGVGALASGLWSYYANTHEPPRVSFTTAPAATPTDSVPVTESGLTPATDSIPAPSNTEPVPAGLTTDSNSESVPTSESGSSSEETPPRKPKKDNKFKEKVKKVGSNIARGYGKALEGAAYGLGFVGVPVGIGYGVYKALQPEPTHMDSALNALFTLMLELLKLEQFRQNLQRMDDMMRRMSLLYNPQDTARSVQTSSPQQSQPDSSAVVGYSLNDL